jgi:anti-sigma28 factor (negative regulator of flagellin synthesis)
MDAMGLAQMRRQAQWHAEELRHSERDLQTAELALENDKKKVEELKKKVAESKRKLEVFNQDVARAQEEVRKQAANQRH